MGSKIGWQPTFRNQPDTRHSTFKRQIESNSNSTLKTLISKSTFGIAKNLNSTFIPLFMGPRKEGCLCFLFRGKHPKFYGQHNFRGRSLNITRGVGNNPDSGPGWGPYRIWLGMPRVPGQILYGAYHEIWPGAHRDLSGPRMPVMPHGHPYKSRLGPCRDVAQTGLGPGRLGLPAQISHGPRPGSLSGHLRLGSDSWNHSLGSYFWQPSEIGKWFLEPFPWILLLATIWDWEVILGTIPLDPTFGNHLRFGSDSWNSRSKSDLWLPQVGLWDGCKK